MSELAQIGTIYLRMKAAHTLEALQEIFKILEAIQQETQDFDERVYLGLMMYACQKHADAYRALLAESNPSQQPIEAPITQNVSVAYTTVLSEPPPVKPVQALPGTSSISKLRSPTSTPSKAQPAKPQVPKPVSAPVSSPSHKKPARKLIPLERVVIIFTTAAPAPTGKAKHRTGKRADNLHSRLCKHGKAILPLETFFQAANEAESAQLLHRPHGTTHEYLPTKPAYEWAAAIKREVTNESEEDFWIKDVERILGHKGRKKKSR